MGFRIFDTLTKVVELSLDYRTWRQNLIAGNVANADTPGYTPVDLDFEETLQRAVDGGTTGARDLSDVDVVFDPTRTPGLDGNSVDLDREMAKMQANAVLYQAGTKIISKKLALLNYAITEGGGR